MRKVKFTDKILKQYPNMVIIQPIISYNTSAYEGPQSKLTNGDYDSIRIRARSTPKGMKDEHFFISDEDKDRYIEDFNNSFVGKNGYAKIVVKSTPTYLQDFDEIVYKFKKNAKKQFAENTSEVNKMKYYVVKTTNVNASDKIELDIVSNENQPDVTVILGFDDYPSAMNYVNELVATGKYYFYDSSSTNFSALINRINKVTEKNIKAKK